MDSGAISQGQVIALVNYMSQILVELVKMANHAALDCRVDGVLQVTSSMEDGREKISAREMEEADSPAVRFEDVSFTFTGSQEPVLEDISFEAKAGEDHRNHRRNRFRKNGAGKFDSTVLRCKPGSGDYFWEKCKKLRNEGIAFP